MNQRQSEDAEGKQDVSQDDLLVFPHCRLSLASMCELFPMRLFTGSVDHVRVCVCTSALELRVVIGHGYQA